MFDLNYFKKLKKNNYKNEPLVDMLFVYEDLALNHEMNRETKINETKIRNDVLHVLMKKEGFPDYPCFYSDHHKHKHKIPKILEINPNIYIFTVINGQLKMETISKVNNAIKSSIYQDVARQYFGPNIQFS